MIRDLIAAIVLTAGIAALVLGGFTVSPAAGWFTLGGCLLMLGLLITAGGTAEDRARRTGDRE